MIRIHGMATNHKSLSDTTYLANNFISGNTESSIVIDRSYWHLKSVKFSPKAVSR